MVRYLLSILHKSKKREPRRGVARAVIAIAIGILLCSGSASAHAPSLKEMKLEDKKYALILLNYNKQQYKCLNNIWSKESRWLPNAVNKSVTPYAYGIPQLRSKYIINQPSFKQIELGVKYVVHRYQTPCKAWKFWQSRKWY